MKSFGGSIRDSAIARFTTAMLVSLLVTSATFSPLFMRSVTSSPLPQDLSQPQALPIPQPGPQSHSEFPPMDYPEPEPCHGVCNNILDPSIFYEEGTYWRFSTSDNISVATAPSLEGPWKFQGFLLPQGTSIFVRPDQHLWAPAVTKRGDTYYCYYAVSQLGELKSQIGVATSQSLDPGTWEDHGAIGLPLNDAYNMIDPYLFQDPDGAMFFTFGSFLNGIHQVQFDNDLELVAWSGGSDRINNIIRNSTKPVPPVVEAAMMYKHEDFYYLFYSVGECCRTLHDGLAAIGDVYRVVVCRAEAATGPFQDMDGKHCLTDNGGTTILASHGDVYAPGGQDITTNDDGRTMISYHYLRPSIGYDNEQKFFGFNYIDWTEDGWPFLVQA